MKEYDVVVIGSGSGANVADSAEKKGLKTALIDKGPIGGTCLNFGCIPSKLLISVADRIRYASMGRELNVDTEVADVDFNAVMNRMREYVDRHRENMKKNLKDSEIDIYESEARFVDDYLLKSNDELIRGKKIFVAAGARPSIPPIDGLDEIDYLTNESVLKLEDKPKSIAILGGGYVGLEYAHFFSAMGAEVTLFQRNKRLVPNEDPEVSDTLKKELGKYVKIHTNAEITSLERNKHGCTVAFSKAGKKDECPAQRFMVALGRKSNSDILQVEKSGIKTDDRGYIKVNRYLETSKKNIWAFGDIIGNEMFRHVANYEATIANKNAFGKEKTKVDYSSAPHAIFTYPEISAVGMTETKVKGDHQVLIGKAYYSDVLKGYAIGEKSGFAKIIVDKKTKKILGCHIVGKNAPILIQEVVNAMSNDLDVHSITGSMHTHPSLTEVITAAIGNIK